MAVAVATLIHATEMAIRIRQRFPNRFGDGLIVRVRQIILRMPRVSQPIPFHVPTIFRVQILV